MRQLAPELEAALESPTVLLAKCLKITRRDGVVIGLTEHNKTIEFQGVSYLPNPGMTTNAITSDLLPQGNDVDIDTALLTQWRDDVVAGRFDGATAESWNVNWELGMGLLELKGEITGMRWTEAGLTLTVETEMEKLERRQGRKYSALCDAQFGDSRCRVANFETDWRVPVSIGNVRSKKLFSVEGSNARARTLLMETGRFAHGRIEILDGRNAGVSRWIVGHTEALLQMWDEFPFPVEQGRTATLTAGCRRDFATCAAYANTNNFRGFPYMPGSEFAGRSATNQCEENTMEGEAASYSPPSTQPTSDGDGPGYGPGSRSGLPEPNLRPENTRPDRDEVGRSVNPYRGSPDPDPEPEPSYIGFDDPDDPGGFDDSPGGGDGK